VPALREREWDRPVAPPRLAAGKHPWRQALFLRTSGPAAAAGPAVGQWRAARLHLRFPCPGRLTAPLHCPLIRLDGRMRSARRRGIGLPGRPLHIKARRGTTCHLRRRRQGVSDGTRNGTTIRQCCGTGGGALRNGLRGISTASLRLSVEALLRRSVPATRKCLTRNAQRATTNAARVRLLSRLSADRKSGCSCRGENRLTESVCRVTLTHEGGAGRQKMANKGRCGSSAVGLGF